MDEGVRSMSFEVSFDELKKRECINCGKKLNILEGYRHPALGKDALLCSECFDKVWESVVRWGRFVIWNSFNPETPDPTYIDNFPFPQEDQTIRHKKIERR
jgi:hypothetical protein